MNDLLYALQQRNLVYNHNFRYFSNADHKTSPAEWGVPDGWQYADPGKLGSLASVYNGLQITTSNDSISVMRFAQALHEFPRWKQMLAGKVVSACVKAKLPANVQLTATLSDGKREHTESWQLDSAGEAIFNLQLTVDCNPKELVISLTCTANAAVIEINTIYANVGGVAIEHLPCIVNGVIGTRCQYIATENAPAEELSLCQAAVELDENQTRLDSVLAGRFGLGKNKRSLLPDMRGYFSRAWDNGASTDPDADSREALGKGSTNKGDNVGTKQPDEFKEHFHSITFSPGAVVTIGEAPSSIPVNPAKSTDTSKVGGLETRAKNIAELFTIKWA